MKILFIGPYRQPDEWGHTSRGILKSLSLIPDVSISSRPIFLTNQTSRVDEDILRLELNKESEYDVLIQHTLPSLMVRHGSFKQNIGFFPLETRNNTEWDNYLHLLDKIFVSTLTEKDCISRELKEKTFVVGGSLENVPSKQISSPSPRFIFYFLGGSLESKTGIDKALEAYLTEFTLNDNVTLMIHSYDSQKCGQKIEQTTKDLGLYTKFSLYPHIHIVSDQPPEYLHMNGACFVDPSYTNGFKRDVATALSIGNPPIITNHTSMTAYVNESNGWLVESQEEILVCPDRPLSDVFTAYENCQIPNVLSIRKSMREAFEDHSGYTKKSKEAVKSKKDVTLEKHSESLREALCM